LDHLLGRFAGVHFIELPLGLGLQGGEVGVGGQEPLAAFVEIVGECRERGGELLTDAQNVVKMIHG
jgi:hypothetical protein